MRLRRLEIRRCVVTKAKDMTAEQAKLYLISQQENLAQRQREYVERCKKEGKKRINTFVSNEAATILECLQNNTKKTIGEIISDALIAYGKTEVLKDQIIIKHVTTNKDKDRPLTGIEYYVSQLANEGFNARQIAGKLSEEGFKTAKGNDTWDREVVRRIMQKIR